MNKPTRIFELIEYAQWHGRATASLRWEDVEMSVGHKFPNDFKVTVSHFPSGAFGNLIRIYSPVQSQKAFEKFKHDGEIMLSSFREHRNMFSFPYPLYPQPGGLIPWAASDDEYYFWKSDTIDPEEWKIVYIDRHVTSYGEYRGVVSQFLLDMMSNLINDSILLFGTRFEDRKFLPFSGY